MKTILVPTDYSEAANNAMRYAIELAKQLDAKLILFHSYHRPILLSSLALLFADDELKKINLERLKAEVDTIKQECCKEVETKIIAYNGRNAIEGILKIVGEHKVDYIVMGTTGVNSHTESPIGSTTISVITKTKTPVFVIPKDAKFKKIEKFVFAHSYSGTTPKNVAEEIKVLCDAFESQLIIYGKPELQGVENSNKVDSVIDNEFAKSGISTVNHVFSFSEEEDQTNEINSFVEFNKADIVAMVPSSSKSFSTIFRQNNAPATTFHSRPPLLILHDNEERE